MKVHGRCHCGHVTFEATVDPDEVTICHCTDCQALTGTAYRVAVPVGAEQFALRSGTPTVYVKVAESGARRAQAFCPRCGSPLYAYDADDARTYGLRVGCLDQRRALVPKRQIWCRSALPWVMDLRAIVRNDRE